MIPGAARCAFTLVAVLILTPAVAAQVLPSPGPAQGHVDLEIRHPNIRVSMAGQNVTVVVFGMIQCAEGAAAPSPVDVVTGVSTDRSELFWVDDAEKSVPWESDSTASPGGWIIQAQLTFRFGTNREPNNISSGTSPVLLVRNDSSDDGCTPNGYEIHGDRDLYTLTVPAEAEPTEGDPVISPGSPAGALLFFATGVLVGVVLTWLAGARMRQRPPQ